MGSAPGMVRESFKKRRVSMKALVSMMCQINPPGFRRRHGLATVSLSTVDEVTASSGWTDRAPSWQLR